MQPEEARVNQVISSKFSSHISYLKMDPAESGVSFGRLLAKPSEQKPTISSSMEEAGADGYRLSDQLSASSSQIFNHIPKAAAASHSNGGLNPIKPPIYQIQRSTSKMTMFEPASNLFHKHHSDGNNAGEASMNLLIMSSSSHSSMMDAETRSSLNGITSSYGGVTSSSNSLRFSYPQTQRNSDNCAPAVSAGAQVAQSFSSSIVKLFESKENSSLACNASQVTVDDIMGNAESQK